MNIIWNNLLRLEWLINLNYSPIFHVQIIIKLQEDSWR